MDLNDFHPEPKNDHLFRVLFVGSLSLRKGIPYLLDALCGLILPDFELCLVGGASKEIEPVLRRYAGKFCLLGFQPRRELSKIYSQASVLVLPSLEEGLALVQAQAMACKIPVISTYNSGAEDLFCDGNEGFIIPARDIQAIRDKVLFLFENSQERERMAEAAYNRVQEIGGWNRYGEHMLMEYKTLLSRKN